MNRYVGIDVSKDTLDVELMDEQQRTRYRQVDNTPAGWAKLDGWLKSAGAAGCRVCLEATGRYAQGVATFLYEAAYAVSVVNPARIRGYANAQLRRNKTDKLDAHVIADFCRTQSAEAWSPPSPQMRVLQGLVRHLAVLESDKGAVANRLRDRAALPALVVEQLHSQQTLLTQHIQQLKQAIQDHIDQYPALKKSRDLIASIKGLGKLTAAKLLAECRPLTAFENVRQLVAFAGLNPAHHQSGSSIRKKTFLSKTGKR